MSFKGTGVLLPAGLAATLLACSPASAWMDRQAELASTLRQADGIHVIDGSYVMNVGELQVNIMNWGYIGSWFSFNAPFSDAPSAQWPAGSGKEYLFSASLWVGGVMLGQPLVSSEDEFRPLPDLADTIYEAVRGELVRPPGNVRAGGGRDQLDPEPDDDGDGLSDEETLDGYDDDGDGLIDEDFAQIGSQMMVLTNYDNTRLAQEVHPDHVPLNLKVVQSTYAWENDSVDDFVGFEFKITNIGATDISNVYIGFFADADIGLRGTPGLQDDDMAGFWPRPGNGGLVRTSDGTWVPVSVGYMFDAAESAPLDGYLGILFLDHDTDPTGRRAPPTVGMRSFQSFSGTQAFQNGGDPKNDDERYTLLSEEEFDNNTAPNRQADFRFLVSAGPFRTLAGDRTLTFSAAMVVGPGLEGLLSNCAEAALAYHGNYFNKVSDFQSVSNPPATVISGHLGRETMLCLEDFAGGGQQNPFDSFVPDVMDTSCVSLQWYLQQERVGDDEIFVVTDPDHPSYLKHCAYFNMDNCFECARQVGHLCTAEGAEIATRAGYTCSSPEIPENQKAGCTGVDGNETQINWLVGMAPPPPGMRLLPSNQAVHVYWSDDSEHAPDSRLNVVDFESYRLWRADNWTRPYGSSIENGPASDLWELIAEYDLENFYVQATSVGGRTVLDTLPLGRNTGLEAIRYTPVCLADPDYQGIWEPMRELVLSDVQGLHRMRPPLRDTHGSPIGGSGSPQGRLLRWEGKPAVLDTFFAVIERPEGPGVRAKRATRYYEYVDGEVHNGYIYFYSVTATDHGLDYEGRGGDYRIVGAGQAGDPGSSFRNAVPGAPAQTVEQRERQGVDIYVFPNPATRAALGDFQQLLPNADDPTGVRVTFANLPAARNTIRIWTLDGDLVEELEHDGTGGHGQVSWNLVSRNGQEIVSGIYLFTVQSANERFEDFIGKFVVIR